VPLTTLPDRHLNAGRYSTRSKQHLAECHPDIQAIATHVIRYIDVKVDEGHRSEAAQNAHHAAGRSRAKWPDSKHNKTPSEAIHFLPYPEGWSAPSERWYYMAGIVLTVADVLYETGVTEHRLRWGGDWNSNDLFADNRFNDLAHFELQD
jgi:peptidoglycan LD-endopeptidase CwlK